MLLNEREENDNTWTNAKSGNADSITAAFTKITRNTSTTRFEDGLATKHNADFMKDARFLRAYELGKQTGSWRHYVIHWRAYVACWAASMGALHEGDFVECGVYRGGFSRMILIISTFHPLISNFTCSILMKVWKIV